MGALKLAPYIEPAHPCGEESSASFINEDVEKNAFGGLVTREVDVKLNGFGDEQGEKEETAKVERGQKKEDKRVDGEKAVKEQVEEEGKKGAEIISSDVNEGDETANDNDNSFEIIMTSDITTRGAKKKTVATATTASTTATAATSTPKASAKPVLFPTEAPNSNPGGVNDPPHGGQRLTAPNPNTVGVNGPPPQPPTSRQPIGEKDNTTNFDSVSEQIVFDPKFSR